MMVFWLWFDIYRKWLLGEIWIVLFLFFLLKFFGREVIVWIMFNVLVVLLYLVKIILEVNFVMMYIYLVFGWKIRLWGLFLGFMFSLVIFLSLLVVVE